MLDRGPLYAETVLGRFPVEPWNTFSNLIFLIVIGYFLIKTKLSWKKYPVTVSALPILFIGFIGGTVYHATRSHHIWLMMDYLPIMILSLLAVVFFWRELLGRIWLACVVGVIPVVVFRLISKFIDLPIGGRITLGYITLAVSILLPALLVARKNQWNNAGLLGATVGLFSLAILCRYADLGFGVALLPMGTHFLWHGFGGLATGFFLEFIYRYEAESQRSHPLK